MPSSSSARDIEQFYFSYGDRRPALALFAQQTLKNITCYHLRRRTLQLPNDRVMSFTCDGAKRVLKIPNNNSFLKGLRNPFDSKLVLIPIHVYSKSRCRRKDVSKHIVYLIHNTVTQELIRFDLRRDHLAGFGMKKLMGNVRKSFMPIMKEIYPDIAIKPELEVDLKFTKTIDNDLTLKNAFPVFAIAFLNVISEDPSKTYEQTVKKTKSLRSKQIGVYWQQYVEWFHEYNDQTSLKCDENHVYNPENSRCMSILSKTFVNNLIDKPVKSCQTDLVFDSLADKCVKPDQLSSINIMMNCLEDININKKTKFATLGKVDKKGMGALSLVISKFPYAKLIVPDEYTKSTSKILWRKHFKSDEFDMLMSEKLWDKWDEAMVDPSIRFLIVLVSLKLPTVSHANVLIYDKTLNELERFDPHGYDQYQPFNTDGLDVVINDTWSKKMETSPIKTKRKFKYFSPKQFCPRNAYILQSKESEDLFASDSDNHGTCAVWRLWYIHVRLANPELSRKQVILYASKKLNENGSVRKFIKLYQKYILTLLALESRNTPDCKEDEILNPNTKRCVKKISVLGKRLLLGKSAPPKS